MSPREIATALVAVAACVRIVFQKAGDSDRPSVREAERRAERNVGAALDAAEGAKHAMRGAGEATRAAQMKAIRTGRSLRRVQRVILETAEELSNGKDRR